MTMAIRAFAGTCMLVAALSSASAQIPIEKVTAKSFQEPNRPQNTLARDKTRWSAEGLGQWIQYTFPGAPTWSVCGVFLDWHLSDRRVQQFTIQLSPDGTTWQDVFSGSSLPGQTGPIFYSVQTPAFQCRGPAHAARIVGNGNTQNQWNSLQFAQFIGFSPDAVPEHAYNLFVHGDPPATVAPAADTEEPWWSVAWGPNPFPFTASYLIPAQQAIAFIVETDDADALPVHVACLAVQWDEATIPFQLEVVADGVVTTLVQEVSGPSAFTVYPIDPPLDYVGAETHVFRLSPLVEAHLAQLLLLLDCNDAPGQMDAKSVQAATFDARPPYNAPGNTLDNDPATRWSAQGVQPITYEVPETVHRAIGIDWWKDDRVNFFDVQMSVDDGTTWYPVIEGGQSRHEPGVEWYEFPASYGSLIRIIGHGNSDHGKDSKKGWNSIVEVQFGQPEP